MFAVVPRCLRRKRPRISNKSAAVQRAAIPRLATVWLHPAALGADSGARPAQKKSPATLGGATRCAKAEGMGFEPTTPFGAPDFESGC